MARTKTTHLPWLQTSNATQRRRRNKDTDTTSRHIPEGTGRIQNKTTAIMDIREVTATIIREARGAEQRKTNWERRVYDKEIAEKIGITPTALSRLTTKTTNPDINTFVKILAYGRNLLGAQRIHKLITNVLDTYNNTKSKQEIQCRTAEV